LRLRQYLHNRKNCLFSANVDGAKASANLYRPIETAKANGLEPVAYLQYVFKELPAADSIEAMEALLPWRLSPAAMASDA
jgi:transposase